jgi:NAD(P)-dependent dehydrogenase (short-subunit alcohol dehydrogenase family)
MVMRVFVAGGTGVMGRRLVPQLVARGHQVTATTTSPAKLGLLEQLGAEAIVMDGLDAASVGEAVVGEYDLWNLWLLDEAEDVPCQSIRTFLYYLCSKGTKHWEFCISCTNALTLTVVAVR